MLRPWRAAYTNPFAMACKTALVRSLRQALEAALASQSTTWHLIDAAHMVQEWHVEGGPKGKSTIHLDFVRKGSDQPTADPASLQQTRPSLGLLALL
jgi:hypothetical protein